MLSGCETGLGELSSGDEFIGLTRAFIYAGTPSVVASLWKVDDASTAHLMSSFYKNLKTQSKVESLRQAQLDMIRGKVNSQLLARKGEWVELENWASRRGRGRRNRYRQRILISGRRLFWWAMASKMVVAGTVLFLFLQAVTANAQQAEFDTSLIGVYRAVSQGESKKALIYYEKEATRYEVLGKSSESPEGYRRAVAQAYREASNAARHLGDLQKAIDYGARALKLAEGVDNANLRLAAISSLEQAHRNTRNFPKAAELTALGLQVAREFPDNSINRLWWDGVFLVKRANKRQRKYEDAIDNEMQSSSSKTI